VRRPFRAGRLCCQNRLLTTRWICHLSCPLPLPEVLRRIPPCDVSLRVPERWSLLPDFDRPSTDSLLFVIPHPLRLGIGPQTVRKTFASRCFCGL